MKIDPTKARPTEETGGKPDEDATVIRPADETVQQAAPAPQGTMVRPPLAPQGTMVRPSAPAAPQGTMVRPSVPPPPGDDDKTTKRPPETVLDTAARTLKAPPANASPTQAGSGTVGHTVGDPAFAPTLNV